MNCQERRGGDRPGGGPASAVKTNDREGMADHLEALGLYATSNAVRAGREPLADGVVHVRNYCLPRAQKAVEEVEARNAQSAPIPGTWGASALPNAIKRRDALQGFLNEWLAYDLNGAIGA